ncbi:MAG TPA: phosphate ABC transporter permease subunit PstC [Thermoanaerobaculia bacterium]|jgi:phosphate transport system permease protein|nr:phosphate ABC transporter permease subunit PstC [Thermoanaerobaculia bacterium]
MARTRRRIPWSDAGFRAATGLAAFLVVGIAVVIGLELFRNSRVPIHEFGWKFWTNKDWDPVNGEFGAYTFIWGTLYSSLIALLLGAPVALGIAIFIVEVGPLRLRRGLGFLTDLLAAVPSIVYGLWGIFVLVPLVRKVETAIAGSRLSNLPIFSGPPYGIGMLAAGIILAIMIVPYISSVAREVLRAVPQSQREAAYALGATKWETIRIVVRYGRSGILGAVFLGLGRALGETMAVTMVIGNSPQISASLFAPQYTMAAVIANEFTEATGDLYLQSLIEIGLVLFAITLAINVLSRFLIWSVSRERRPRPRATPARLPEPA